MPESHHAESNSFWKILLMLVNQWIKTTLLHDAHVIAKTRSTTDSYPEAMKINLSSTSTLSFQEFKCTKHPNIRTIDEENHLSSLALKFSKAHLIHLFNQILPTNSHPSDMSIPSTFSPPLSIEPVLVAAESHGPTFQGGQWQRSGDKNPSTLQICIDWSYSKEEARHRQCFSASSDVIIEVFVLKHFPCRTWKIANCFSNNNKYPFQKESQDPILSGFPGIVSHQAHFALTNDATCDLNPTKCGEMMWVDGCCLRGAKVVWHAQLNAPQKRTNEQLSFRVF